MTTKRSILVAGATGQQGGAVARALLSRGHGADADIAALRGDFSEVRWHSFADWAREFDWSVLERTSSVA
jgi:uncharacterized protein YbjT (DUF2867 family)